MRKFTMVVAGRFETQVEWDGENTPDIIIDDVKSEAFIKVGRITSEVPRFGYRPATCVNIEV